MSAVPAANKWSPITDIRPELRHESVGELQALQPIWQRYRDELGQRSLLAKFNEQVAREWAIETGIIEGIYSLDRGITQTLIEHGILAELIPHNATDRNPERVARIIQDHQEVLESLFSFVRRERELTVGYIKEIHSALLRNQETYTVTDQFGKIFDRPLSKGVYKSLPNNPTRPDGTIHEYCPPEHVAAEMDQMVALNEIHRKEGVPVEVQAAWLHHAFTQIHPFEDGNGRVARALATIVFIRSGHMPLTITVDSRKAYLDALEAADQGDLTPLVRLFVKAQREHLKRAVSLVQSARPSDTIDEEIGRAMEKLQVDGMVPRPEWLESIKVADALSTEAENILRSTDKKIRQASGRVQQHQTKPRVKVSGPTEVSTDERALIDSLPYRCDLNAYHRACSLVLTANERQFLITVSFHAYGTTFHGVIAVMAGIYDVQRTLMVLLSQEPFLIRHTDLGGETLPHFINWLNHALKEGLKTWNDAL
jgi:Fic family protein